MYHRAVIFCCLCALTCSHAALGYVSQSLQLKRASLCVGPMTMQASRESMFLIWRSACSFRTLTISDFHPLLCHLVALVLGAVEPVSMRLLTRLGGSSWLGWAPDTAMSGGHRPRDRTLGGAWQRKIQNLSRLLGVHVESWWGCARSTPLRIKS